MPTIRALLEAGAKASAVAVDGTTPLHIAAAVVDDGVPVINCLVDAGAKVSKKLKDSGCTPLHLAAHGEGYREQSLYSSCSCAAEYGSRLAAHCSAGTYLGLAWQLYLSCSTLSNCGDPLLLDWQMSRPRLAQTPLLPG